MAENNSIPPQKIRFSIFIDPPDTVWATSTIGMLYALKSLSDVINEVSEPGEFGPYLHLVQTTLAGLLTNVLAREGLSPSTESRIREIIKAEAHD